MKITVKTVAGVGVTALGALIAITPRYIFPVCEYFGVRMEMMGKTLPMGCYYTARASLLAGLFVGLIGIAIMSAKPQALRTLSILLAGAATAVVLIPTVLFPICHNPDMHCNHGTQPLLIVLGITGLLTSGWMAYASRSKSIALKESVASAGVGRVD